MAAAKEAPAETADAKDADAKDAADGATDAEEVAAKEAAAKEAAAKTADETPVVANAPYPPTRAPLKAVRQEGKLKSLKFLICHFLHFISLILPGSSM